MISAQRIKKIEEKHSNDVDVMALVKEYKELQEDPLTEYYKTVTDLMKQITADVKLRIKGKPSEMKILSLEKAEYDRLYALVQDASKTSKSMRESKQVLFGTESEDKIESATEKRHKKAVAL